jgi:ferric citrate transport system permease protein
VTAVLPSVRSAVRREASGRGPVGPLLGLTLVALVLTVYSVSVSGAGLPFGQAVAAAVGVHNGYYQVVQDDLLPRVLLCWVVGAGLGVAGGVTQSVIRNPLASPDVIGVSRGAGAAAAVLALIAPSVSVDLLPLAAFAGGLLAFAVVYAVAYRRGAPPVRLALTGIAVGAVCDSIIRFTLVRWPTDINSALVWMVGSLYGRTRADLLVSLPWCAVLIPVVLLYSRRLDVLTLGDDLAANLGERVERTRFVALLLAVLLASSAVAVAGAIGFVGLVAPRIALRLTGPRHLRYLPASGLLGVVFMLAADTLARGLHPPLEIPAGLITAFIGGPYFLYLLVRNVR